MSSNSFKIRNSVVVLPVSSPTLVDQGEMAYDSVSDKLKIRNASSTDSIVQEALIQTLTNKTIAAGSNTISGLANGNLSGSAAISNANLAAMATGTIKANLTGSSAVPSDVSLAAVVAALGAITSLTGDVVAAGPGAAASTIQANVVSNAKLAQMATLTLKGNNTGSTANASDLTVAQVQSMLGVPTSSSPLPLNAGGTNASLTASNGAIPYSTASALALLAPGLPGQALISQGAATPKWGSVSSGGSKNYLSSYIASTSSGTSNPGNGDFETNTTSGWSLAHSSITNSAPSSVASPGSAFSSSSGGSAASGNLSLAVTSSANIGGSYSGSLASSAASVVGDMLISNAFFIDKEDQAKVMQVKFYFSPTAGANNLNFSGSSSNSYAVWIYDVTNGAWIMPAGVYNITQSSGVGYCTATFQTTSNSTQYQLALVNINASAGSFTVVVDDLSVGPQIAPSGPVVTDPVAYTPIFQGLGTPTSVNLVSWRVGKYLFVEGSFISGTTTGVEARIGLGFNGVAGNVVVDSTALPVIRTVGKGAVDNLAARDYQVLSEPGVTYLTIGYQESTTSAALTKQNGNSVQNSGSKFSFFARVPITGWSSNTLMSSDTDTRVVAFNAPSQAGTGTLSGTFNIVKLATVSKDTHSGYNPSTGFYTAPVTGYYQVTGAVDVLSTITAGQFIGCQVQNITTAYQVYGYLRSPVTGTIDLNPVATGLMFANAGDQIGLYSVAQGSSLSYSTTTGGCSFAIQRVSGPAVVAATESVNLRYTDVSGSALSGTSLTMLFATKDYDTHGAWNGSTGTFTAPVSGKYLITFRAQAGGAFNGTIHFFKNGSQISVGAGISSYYLGNEQFNLVAGDTLQFKLDSAGTPNLSTTAGANALTIARIGN